MVTVLILEDDENILSFLEYFLNKHPLVSKVIAVNNSQKAILVAQNNFPHIVLLDIKLGSNDALNGIQTGEIITKLCPETVCLFLTAYGNYALDAYITHPYDYLLKPINPEKLFKTITDIVLKKEKRRTNKITFRTKDGIVMLSPDSIGCVEKNSKKTIIYTDQESYETNYNLLTMENRLPDQFIRVHNSYIINISRVRMIKHTSSRNYQIIIENCPVTAYMSRKKYDEFRHLFEVG